MPFLLAEILNFQGSTHHIGVGSFSNYDMTTGGVNVVGENSVTQVTSVEVTIDNAASNVKYTKISVKIDPKTSGANATQTLDGAEITLYAE